MLYLGCDQHARQVTVCLRNEDGDILLRRQVSTEPEKMSAFLDDMNDRAKEEDGYVAIVEVCGFNDWFVDMLKKKGCQDVVLIQPAKKATRKTDHRDAAQLSELLWINRERLREGKRVHGLRRVHLPSTEDRELRKLTTRRALAQQRRGRVVALIKTVLRNRNLQHDCPVKNVCCGKGIAWLRTLSLPAADRLEMNHLLEQWEQLTTHVDQIDALLEEQHKQRHIRGIAILTTIPGCAFFSAMVLLCRIGDLSKFPNPRSLANYFGLTPTCKNSGQSTRIGRISKEGSALARFVLGMMVTHVVKKDPWMREFYRRIKRRRGTKTARVAVMRRLCVIIYHMLKHNVPYVIGGPKKVDLCRQANAMLQTAEPDTCSSKEQPELTLQT